MSNFKYRQLNLSQLSQTCQFHNRDAQQSSILLIAKPSSINPFGVNFAGIFAMVIFRQSEIFVNQEKIFTVKPNQLAFLNSKAFPDFVFQFR